MGSESSPVAIDVPVEAAWRHLAEDAGSILIDVRTRAEWNFVGVPDLSSLGKALVLVEWQGYPEGRPNAGFVTELSEKLTELGARRDSELFFICRSGARSRLAAEAMLRAGYTRCHNVAEGFEGPLDSERHRGSQGGWRAEGLPWVQS